MKSIKIAFAFAALCLVPAASAWADHYHGGHVHFGVVIDPFAPWYYGPYGYYPYYPPPVVVTQQVAPPVYVEQAAPAQAQPGNMWYYCAASKTYYPYVKDCPAGWQSVTPTPPSQ